MHHGDGLSTVENRVRANCRWQVEWHKAILLHERFSIAHVMRFCAHGGGRSFATFVAQKNPAVMIFREQ